MTDPSHLNPNPPPPAVKDIVSLTPGASARADEGVVLTSAADYVKHKQRLQDLKSKGKGVGFAPPIPEGKLASLIPQPEFGNSTPSPAQQEPPPRERPPMLGGVGSAYEVNQAMAAGAFKGPVSMAQAKRQGLGGVMSSEEKKSLSEDTVKLLNEQNQRVQETEKEDSASGEPMVPEAPDQEELDSAEREIFSENFFVPQIGFSQVQSELLSQERRKSIESRLEPLRIDDMILKGEIQQVIPVILDKLYVTLRSFSQAEHLWCLRYIHEHPGSNRYVDELFETARTACCLVAVNDKLLPEHRKDGVVERDLFEKKVRIIQRFPTHMVMEVGIQMSWFNDRISKLFTLDNLKNG